MSQKNQKIILAKWLKFSTRRWILRKSRAKDVFHNHVSLFLPNRLEIETSEVWKAFRYCMPQGLDGDSLSKSASVSRVSLATCNFSASTVPAALPNDSFLSWGGVRYPIGVSHRVIPRLTEPTMVRGEGRGNLAKAAEASVGWGGGEEAQATAPSHSSQSPWWFCRR